MAASSSAEINTAREIYHPLQDQQIRVINLYPGERQSPIICSLQTCYLNASFEALSYCWGDPSDRPSIICDGTSFPVTKSLFGALKALRSDHIRSIWIDAICINQDDIGERNAQVQLMGQIYQAAQQVVIWLGEHGDDTAPAMDLLSNIARGTKLDAGSDGIVGFKQNLEKSGMPSASDPMWNSLQVYLSRPWFTRIWVVQEAIMARKAIVTCGNRQITWDDFHRAADAIDTINYGGLIDMQNLHIMGLHRYKRRLEEKDLDITRLLFGERVQSATDDRDRVFSLLGLATDVGGVLQLQADYHLTTAEVYINSARAIINAHRSLSILTAAGILSSPSKYRLPTWVPDWSISGNAWPLMCRVGELNYTASNNVEADIIPLNSTSIHASTITHDTISEISPPFPQEDRSRALMSWIILAEADPSHIDRLEAFLRTVIANLGFGSESPTPYEQVASLEWYKRILSANGYELSLSAFGLPECSAEEAEARYLRFSSLVTQASSNRSFFVTRDGLMGIGPRGAAVGDWVCIVKGACVPLILRGAVDNREEGWEEGRDGKGKFEFVGDAYVDGIMCGEGYDDSKLQRCEII